MQKHARSSSNAFISHTANIFYNKQQKYANATSPEPCGYIIHRKQGFSAWATAVSRNGKIMSDKLYTHFLSVKLLI